MELYSPEGEEGKFVLEVRKKGDKVRRRDLDRLLINSSVKYLNYAFDMEREKGEPPALEVKVEGLEEWLEGKPLLSRKSNQEWFDRKVEEYFEDAGVLRTKFVYGFDMLRYVLVAGGSIALAYAVQTGEFDRLIVPVAGILSGKYMEGIGERLAAGKEAVTGVVEQAVPLKSVVRFKNPIRSLKKTWKYVKNSAYRELTRDFHRVASAAGELSQASGALAGNLSRGAYSALDRAKEARAELDERYGERLQGGYEGVRLMADELTPEDIDRIWEDVAAIEKSYLQLKNTYLPALTSVRDGLNTHISSLSNTIADLEGISFDSAYSSLDTANSKIDSASSRVSGIVTGNLAALRNKTSQLGTVLSDVRAGVANIGTYASDLEAYVNNDLQAAIDDINGVISQLDATIAQLDAERTNLINRELTYTERGTNTVYTSDIDADNDGVPDVQWDGTQYVYDMDSGNPYMSAHYAYYVNNTTDPDAIAMAQMADLEAKELYFMDQQRNSMVGMRGTLSSTVANLVTLKDNMLSKIDSIKSKVDEINGTNGKMDQADSLVGDLSSQYDAIEAELGNVQGDLASAKDAISQARAAVESVESSLQDYIDSLKTTKAGLEADRDNLDSTIAGISGELDSMDTALYGDGGQRKGLIASREGLKQYVQEQSDTIAQLDQTVSQKDSEIYKLEAANRSYAGKVKQLTQYLAGAAGAALLEPVAFALYLYRVKRARKSAIGSRKSVMGGELEYSDIKRKHAKREV